MLEYANSYGKKFISNDGHSILVHNYNMGYTINCNNGIGTDRTYLDLDKMEKSLDEIKWLSDNHKNEIKSAMENLYVTVREIIDKEVHEITYHHTKNNIFHITKKNKYGHKIYEEESVHHSYLEERLEYLKEVYKIKPVEVYIA